jgi:hypothetical protein
MSTRGGCYYLGGSDWNWLPWSPSRRYLKHWPLWSRITPFSRNGTTIRAEPWWIRNKSTTNSPPQSHVVSALGDTCSQHTFRSYRVAQRLYFSPGINKCTPEGRGGSSRFGLTGGLLPTSLIPSYAAFTYSSLAITLRCLNMRFLHQKHLLKTLKETTAFAYKRYSLMPDSQSRKSPYNSTLHSIKSNMLSATALHLKNSVLDVVLYSVLQRGSN